jgi:hypothetical protein
MKIELRIKRQYINLLIPTHKFDKENRKISKGIAFNFLQNRQNKESANTEQLELFLQHQAYYFIM